jgi:hypothetical protein
METQSRAHARLQERNEVGPHQVKDSYVGFNGRLAEKITNAVGTMWCAYFFTLIAFLGLPTAIHGGEGEIVTWLTQTFLQLVLLSVILVGQKVAARASDKQALQTYKDAEALLKMQDDIHKLVLANNKLTEQIYTILEDRKR